MSEIVDLEKEGSSSPSSQSKAAFHSIQPMVKQKPKIQLTFNDFQNVKVTSSPTDMLKKANELLEQSKRRRSSRVVPKKKPESDDEDIRVTRKPAKKKRKLKQKQKQKQKQSNIKKEAVRARAKNASKTTNKSSAAGKTAAKPIGIPTPEPQEPQLNTQNWSPNMPLSFDDFKNQHGVVSRFKSPNLKVVPYAKDLMRIMTFINKFNMFLPTDLWNLSVQDFEVGLDLYPDHEEALTLYQDYLLRKDIVRCQDRMNLFFLTLMKLALNNNSTTTVSSLNSSSKPFAKFTAQLRLQAKSWGYPPEWRNQTTSAFLEPQDKIFPEDDIEPVDPTNPEILTPNIYIWHQHQPAESDPLANSDLDKFGILALEPADRIICLRILTQWCITNSNKIHGEIFRLSHFKKDPPFGVQTTHAPRVAVEGQVTTKQRFMNLCELMRTKLEIKRNKKYIKKQLENGKREDLSTKLKILDEIKSTGHSLEESIEKDYYKWCQLFQGEIPDHPYDSPFKDDIYKLRCQEFLVGRVPHVGDFYIPRLFTYQDTSEDDTEAWIPSTYSSPHRLIQLFQDFSQGKVDAFQLFSKNVKRMSLQFKLFYHDTPSMISDFASNSTIDGKNYWYELCDDSKSLQEFINLLDYKLGAIHDEEEVQESATDEEGSKAEKVQKVVQDENFKQSTINKKPFPKESRFNASRQKLQVLKDYLNCLYFVLKKYEEVREQYGDINTGDRTLRRSQRNKVNYVDGLQSDGDDEFIDEAEDYNVDDDNEGDDSDGYEGQSQKRKRRHVVRQDSRLERSERRKARRT